MAASCETRSPRLQLRPGTGSAELATQRYGRGREASGNLRFGGQRSVLGTQASVGQLGSRFRVGSLPGGASESHRLGQTWSGPFFRG